MVPHAPEPAEEWPNSSSIDTVKTRIQDFARLYNRIAEPFDWNFTRRRLRELTVRLESNVYRDTG